MRFLLLIILGVLYPAVSHAQTSVTGIVRDSISQEPIAFAKLTFIQSKAMVRSDINGVFNIQTSFKTDTLIAESLGYVKAKFPLASLIGDTVFIDLNESNYSLNAVVVTAGENPAFQILEEVKKNKKKNDPEQLSAYQCEVYNKMQFDVNNMSDDFKNKKAYKKFDFIMDYMDTVNGKNFLPVLLTESISAYYYKTNPTQKKEIIKANRITGVDNLQLGQFTGDMYQKVNIYDDYLELFNKEFLSPIASEGKLFYKYLLLDDDTLSDGIFYHIAFRPKRKGDALFKGEIWIAKAEYAVRKVVAHIPDDVNLNYVSDFKVEQVYSKIDSTVYMLTQEYMVANFDLFNEMEESKLVGATIHKTVNRKNFQLNQPLSFDFYLENIVISDSADNRDDTYWQAERHTGLTNQEQGVIEMVDSLKGNKTYQFYEDLTYLAYTGFWRTGPIEIGHLYTAFNQNVVEGNRLMISLRTSNKFSKKVEISGFAGYGTLDETFKYGGSVRFKLKESPREMLRFAYRKRIDQLGLQSSIGEVGNAISLLSVGPLDKLTMVNLGSVGLEKDWNINMRTFNAVEWKRYTALGSSDYSRINPVSGDTNKVVDLTSFEVRNQIMYTKEEKFLKGQFDRISLGSKYPIISLTHTWGIKNVLESEYNFHRLDFIWTHRPRLGMLGRLEYTFHAGKIFGQVPYPFLEIHQGNESYILKQTNFNLMNYYEFISDQWVSFSFEHHLQGFIMDRIPLINKLKTRLVYSGKMVVGTYSEMHNQELLLPFYSNQFSSPYYEVGVGLENIVKFIRIDAIWRLSYRDNVNLYGEQVTNFGIKFMFTSDF